MQLDLSDLTLHDIIEDSRLKRSTKMSSYTFSKPINFVIHVPMLLMNLFVVGGLVWDMTPSTQIKIFANHTSHVSPVVSLVASALATVYGLTLILLAVFNIVIPALPRILIDSIILWPCHLISIIVLGLWNNWSALKQIAAGQVGNPAAAAGSAAAAGQTPTQGQTHAEGQTQTALEASPAHEPAAAAHNEGLVARFLATRELTCTDPSWTPQQCAQRWKTITIIQTIAFAFGWLCLLLVTIDFILAVRIYQRRKAARAAGKNPDDDTASVSESVQGLTANRTEEVGGRWVTVTGRN